MRRSLRPQDLTLTRLSFKHVVVPSVRGRLTAQRPSWRNYLPREEKVNIVVANLEHLSGRGVAELGLDVVLGQFYVSH